MSVDAPPRPRLKHAMTATAFALVQIRMTWRQYFLSLQAERRQRMIERRRGW